MSLKDKIKIIPRLLIEDDRGWFIKVITGKEDSLPNATGEIYLTMGKPGQARGGHYHPKAKEWFTIVEGKATLLLEDIETREKLELNLSFDNATTVFIPNGIAHVFVNEGEQRFVLLAYTNLLYDSKDTIPYDLKNGKEYE